MRIATVLGTRPEIIRLSRIIPALDACCEQVLVHTGQNYDRTLSPLFFEQLGVRAPDVHLDPPGHSFGAQMGRILEACEEVFRRTRPDRLLVLGDTNSALSAIVAKRMGIPVFHAEAGNRCHDDRVPEEVNRRIIDHASDVLLAYTERARSNLLAEGFADQRLFVIGNPMYEVIQAYRQAIDESSALSELSLSPRGYFLVTLHRAENIDRPPRLQQFLHALAEVHRRHRMPVIVSTHPRLRQRLPAGQLPAGVQFLEPFGLFDFLKLQGQAFCVLSDSGTVQDECAILRIPSVTLRDVTERPETLDCGSNMLSGAGADEVLRAIDVVTAGPPDWQPPAEYLRGNVSNTVARLVTGYHHGLPGA